MGANTDDEDRHMGRARRHSRITKGTLHDSSGETQEILVRNLSARGIGGKLANGCVAAGERVTVTVPGIGTVDAIVRWTRNRAVGLETEQEIDPTALTFSPDQRLAAKPEGYRPPRSFEPETDHRRPGFSRLTGMRPKGR